MGNREAGLITPHSSDKAERIHQVMNMFRSSVRLPQSTSEFHRKDEPFNQRRIL